MRQTDQLVFVEMTHVVAVQVSMSVTALHPVMVALFVLAALGTGGVAVAPFPVDQLSVAAGADVASVVEHFATERHPHEQE